MSRTAHKLLSASGGKAYEIDSSLMFNAADTAYLKRTPSSAGNRRTFTLSAWVKMTSVGSNNGAIFCCGTGTNDASTTYVAIYQGTIQWQGYNTNYRKSNRLLRDVGAWYHLVYAIDTTIADGSADNRIRIYVNGEEITDWHTKNNPAQNYEFIINSTNEHQLGDEGAVTGGITPWDGYMAEFHFIDGTQLTPSSFGETDAATNQWIPKEYTGGSYGTNGFYMPWKKNDRYSVYFDDTSNTGISIADSSDWDFGTNNFTVECWIYRNEDAGDQSYIFGQADNTNGSNSGNSVYISVYDQHLSGIAVDASNTNNYVYLYSTADSTTIEDNKWYHVAMVRSGNDWNLYLNGTSIDSETTSITVNSCSSVFGVGKQGVYNDGFWKGWISNFRLVMGTAVYTSNFTPPTSPLTAITNTKLLCCQDADPTVDNSGTGKTLTVTAANTYTQQMAPFQFDWYQDQSGQDNDYHPDNITVNDVMLDSPTNNFATFNSLDNGSNITLSQGNLRSSGSGWGDTFSTIKIPHTGKWYIELLLVADGNLYFGLWTDNYTDTDASQDYGTGKQFTHSGSVTGGASGGYISGGTSTGDLVSMAVDCDAGKLYWAIDGTWGSSGNPATGANPGLTFTATDNYKIIMAGASGHQTIINFGQNGTFSGTKIAQGNADGAGIGNFFYSPPSGFKALCSKNLPTPAIKKPEEHFNTVLYTGSDDDAVSQNVTGVGFQPDLIWIKRRNLETHHVLTDAVRGATKVLNANRDVAEVDDTYGVTAFGSDGFTVREQASAGGQTNTGTLVSWNWKAGGSGSSNGDGAQTTTVSANTTAGFSIAACTGTGSSTTYGHGLGTTPEIVILKSRSGADDWYFFTTSIDGSWDYMYLNEANGKSDTSTIANSTTITTSFGSGTTFIAYSFAEVEGFSKFGSYTGNGNNPNGPYIYTGFKPAWVMIHTTAGGTSWIMLDNKRDPHNPAGHYVLPDLANAEADFDRIDFLSNGFKLRQAYTGDNSNGVVYFYMAFAEAPFKYANAR